MNAPPQERAVVDADARVSEVVKLLMRHHHQTQARMGDVLGVSQTQISKRLRCEVRWTFADVEVLAEAFRVPIDWFGREPADVLFLLAQRDAHRPVSARSERIA